MKGPARSVPSASTRRSGGPAVDQYSANASSGKQYSQRSPGSAEAMTGWPLARACLLAWRLGELSQQSVHAAFLAGAQVDPAGADLHALLALAAFGVA